jgi:two-component system chemotaxis response regulator CheB
VAQQLDTSPVLSTHAPPSGVVAMAASAGGLRALTQLFAALPADFPAPIVVVQHVAPSYRSLLASILARHTELEVLEAREGQPLRPATVYIAPPNHHVLVNADGTLSLSSAELVHYVRPSADLLFESAAASFKDRAIAVILTGVGHDGTPGFLAIKQQGGTVIAQDEASSEFFGMPSTAIQTGQVDYVLPLADIPATLVRLVGKGSGR